MRPDRSLLAIVMVVEAATFFVGAYLHTGRRIDLGAAALDEPRIIGATVVETICGVALLAGAGQLAASRSGRGWAIGADGVAIGGVLLGMLTLAFDLGPRTRTNDVYHVVVLSTLLLGLVWLIWLAGRERGAASPPR